MHHGTQDGLLHIKLHGFPFELEELLLRLGSRLGNRVIARLIRCKTMDARNLQHGPRGVSNQQEEVRYGMEKMIFLGEVLELVKFWGLKEAFVKEEEEGLALLVQEMVVGSV